MSGRETPASDVINLEIIFKPRMTATNPVSKSAQSEEQYVPITTSIDWGSKEFHEVIPEVQVVSPLAKGNGKVTKGLLSKSHTSPK